MQIKAVLLCNRYVKISARLTRRIDAHRVDTPARFVFSRPLATRWGLLTLLTDQYGLVPLPEPRLENVVDTTPMPPTLRLSIST